jgi:hypothetical protein
MPVTKFQNLVFTAIMVFCMVFCMAAYNSALQNGLSYTTFPLVLRTMWPEAAAAFVL